jgi:hypothetical protein
MKRSREWRNVVDVFESALEALKLGSITVATRILICLLAASGVALIVVVTVQDWASGSPSSTEPLLIPFVALYVGIAAYVVAWADVGIRWAWRRTRKH